MSAIRLRNIQKRFGEKPVLAGLDLELSLGSVLGFLGSNGAGKTTTLRIVLGLVRPDSGDVSVLGHDPRTDSTAVRAATGVLFDRDGHYERLTARANLEFHAGARRLGGKAAHERIEDLLRGYGLWERRDDRVSTFSRGMRQKLAIARALLHRPKLLLLDEPFTGLDPGAAVELRERLRGHAVNDGVAVLLTTHDLHHVEKVCDRVVLLEKGKVVASGTPEELTGEPLGTTQEVHATGDHLTDEILFAMRDEGRILSGRLDGGKAIISCSPAQAKEIGRELVHRGVRLQSLTTKTRTLEDLFVHPAPKTEVRRD